MFHACELTAFIMSLTQKAFKASNLPEIKRTEINYMMVNPPLSTIGKPAYEGVRAAIANSLNFRRLMDFNPTICFSQDGDVNML